MCFTPQISIATAITEWLVSIFLFWRYRKSVVARFSAFFITLLGLYQFTEYMLCQGDNPALWAKIGFATYTFLPALALDFGFRYLGKRKFNWAIFLPPIIFSLFAFLSQGFVTEALCSTVFIKTNLTFFSPQGEPLLTIFYLGYYSIFIIATCFLLIKKFLLTEKKNEKAVCILGIIGAIITLGPALILMIILPYLSLQFPSVFCQFALLYTITALIAAVIDTK